jgi:hypothetical protein
MLVGPPAPEMSAHMVMRIPRPLPAKNFADFFGVPETRLSVGTSALARLPKYLAPKNGWSGMPSPSGQPALAAVAQRGLTP